MASLYPILNTIFHTEDDIGVECEKCSSVSGRKYSAAVKIQKLFRGYSARKYLKIQHHAATLIQKTFRGWQVRYKLPDMMHEYFDRICLKQYTDAATRIQTLWRGYRVRKYEANIHQIMLDKRKAIEANEKMRHLINNCRKQDKENCVKECSEILSILFNRHHLLRTYQKEGLFSIQGSEELSQIEQLLNDTVWADYMENIRKIYAKYHTAEDDNTVESYSATSVEKMLESERNIEQKPFVFKKVDEQPYQKMITSSLENSSKLLSPSKMTNLKWSEFNLNVNKIVKHDEKPYRLDFWYRQCKIHNL